jgi:hypothetical protein
MLDKESKDGLINLDDWRWPDVNHLADMGFEFGDDFHMSTPSRGDPDNPHITIYKKKEKDADGKVKFFFYVEEPERAKKRFKEFNEVIDYFDTYPQPAIDKNK